MAQMSKQSFGIFLAVIEKIYLTFNLVISFIALLHLKLDSTMIEFQ